MLLVVSDPRALGMLPELAAELRLLIVVTGEAAELADPGLPRGHLTALRGHIGKFVARLALRFGERELDVAQVVLAAATRPQTLLRTGVHWLRTDEAGAPADLLLDLASRSGTFERAHAVLYDEALCVGGEREQEACGRCLPACPYGAIARGLPDRTRMQLDHLACEGCGACAAVCPTSALALIEPGLGEFLAAAQRQLAASGAPAPWILLHCGEEGRRFIEQSGDLGGEVLALPCLRAVSDAAILGAFALGAAGLALVGCESCKHGERAVLLETLERNRLILSALGLDSGGGDSASPLRLFPVTEGREAAVRAELAEFAAGLAPSPIPTPSEPFEELHANEVVAWALYLLESRLVSAASTVLLPPGSPYARAEVDQGACTVCGSCATVCAPKAFQYAQTLDQVLLEFRPRSCVACGLCEAICPEGAIRLNHELLLGDEARRHATVARDEWASCTICGAPVFSAKALAAIEHRLGDAPAPAGLPTASMSDWLRTCHPCRANAMRRGP